jgi:hypothetical protein
VICPSLLANARPTDVPPQALTGNDPAAFYLSLRKPEPAPRRQANGNGPRERFISTAAIRTRTWWSIPLHLMCQLAPCEPRPVSGSPTVETCGQLTHSQWAGGPPDYRLGTQRPDRIGGFDDTNSRDLREWWRPRQRRHRRKRHHKRVGSVRGIDQPDAARCAPPLIPPKERAT